jgi:hypothetical protein
LPRGASRWFLPGREEKKTSLLRPAVETSVNLPGASPGHPPKKVPRPGCGNRS